MGSMKQNNLYYIRAYSAEMKKEPPKGIARLNTDELIRIRRALADELAAYRARQIELAQQASYE